MSATPDPQTLQEIPDRRIGGIRVLRSHWLACFEIHHARVPAYRRGRVFLAGDAAHIHSPAGGQGMNTGMQDAFNPAWKLAAVIAGEAGDALLNSYEAERIPIADGVIACTDRLTKAATLSGLPRRVRDVVIHMISRVPAARRFTAETATEVFTHIADAEVQKQLGTVVGPEPGHVVLTVAGAQVTANDTTIEDPKGVVAQRFGFDNGGSAIIRPDSYIAAIADLDDTTTIANYFDNTRS